MSTEDEVARAREGWRNDEHSGETGYVIGNAKVWQTTTPEEAREIVRSRNHDIATLGAEIDRLAEKLRLTKRALKMLEVITAGGKETVGELAAMFGYDHFDLLGFLRAAVIEGRESLRVARASEGEKE